MTVTISPAYEGRLLRSYLKNTLSLSTSALARLKTREDGITVNGVRVTVRYVLHAGDLLQLAVDDTPDTATRTVLPAEAPLDVLYEDDLLIILNKPAGMPTHPSHGHLTDTLANALAYRYARAGVPFVFRSMGRLDRNTSGVVVVAKTQAVAGFLGGCLVGRRVTKRYLAVLEGQLPAGGNLHRIEVPIRLPASGVAMRTAAPGSDPNGTDCEYALTTYRVLAASERYTLVLAMPHTGRTHQLRVHFAHIGHPLCGDEVYGRVPTEHAPIGRQALHCLSLSFPVPFSTAADRHATIPPMPEPTVPVNFPSDDGWMHTFAPLPPDMEALLCTAFPALNDSSGSWLRTPTAADLVRQDDPWQVSATT